MRIDVFSIFPGAVRDFASHTLLGKAIDAGRFDLRTWDLRDRTTDRHRSVDAPPFGGGAGMVMSPQPIFDAVEQSDAPRPVFLLTAGGRRFDQSMATELSHRGTGFSLICGRYEGVDQRVSDELCDGELSVGDMVLSGGEVAALVVIEAVVRLLPGVMGNTESATEESFSTGLLEYPHYTRPGTFRSWSVPEVLLSGDHERVRRWRLAQALLRTQQLRPDLLDARGLDREDLSVLEEFHPDGLELFDPVHRTE